MKKHLFIATLLLGAVSVFTSCSNTTKPDDGQEIVKSDSIDEHKWVDLGLPSGTLWATCNVGAKSPEEFGDYFAWSETEPKDEYSWENYKHLKIEGSKEGFTKYCTEAGEGYEGFMDNKTELDPEDDAATAKWGKDWQMPSGEQLDELINEEYTTTELTTKKDVKGLLITSKSNGKSIFLPAAGARKGTISLNEDLGCSAGRYFSRSKYYYTDYDKFDNNDAHFLGFSDDKDLERQIYTGGADLYYGLSVRPVRKK